tara:strand:+ start:4734 stop:4904 length:171 start_codon:yes stop_codon:yes gene_type:complete
MGIKDAYNALRHKIASRIAGRSYPSPEPWDYREADAEIDAMSNTQLLAALAECEEG